MHIWLCSEFSNAKLVPEQVVRVAFQNEVISDLELRSGERGEYVDGKSVSTIASWSSHADTMGPKKHKTISVKLQCGSRSGLIRDQLEQAVGAADEEASV